MGPAPTPIQCHTDHNPTYTPECPSGYTCEAILGGNTPNAGICVELSTPAPTPEPVVKCHTDHNPTYTPECPSGYTCQAVLDEFGKKTLSQNFEGKCFRKLRATASIFFE